MAKILIIGYLLCGSFVFGETDVSTDIVISNLKECIQIALKNNRNRQTSQYDIEIAESQYKQALSSYWPQLKGEILASRMELEQVFFNLLANSRDAIEEKGKCIRGQIHITTNYIKNSDNKGFIESRFKDNGVGIAIQRNF
ncbi:MAG: TolC family protein [Desulfobacterales bacterium]|nr:TolC family protein [Desulfobacterales bacterium]